MAWKALVLSFMVLTIASGAVAGAPEKPGLSRPAKTKPIGHTPRPVQDIGRTDLFHGYRCGAGDCLLHQQGYQWGAVHRVANPRDCRGTSEEFIEGCLAFAGIEGPLGQKDFDASFPHMTGID